MRRRKIAAAAVALLLALAAVGLLWLTRGSRVSPELPAELSAREAAGTDQIRAADGTVYLYRTAERGMALTVPDDGDTLELNYTLAEEPSVVCRFPTDEPLVGTAGANGVPEIDWTAAEALCEEQEAVQRIPFDVREFPLDRSRSGGSIGADLIDDLGAAWGAEYQGLERWRGTEDGRELTVRESLAFSVEPGCAVAWSTGEKAVTLGSFAAACLQRQLSLAMLGALGYQAAEISALAPVLPGEGWLYQYACTARFTRETFVDGEQTPWTATEQTLRCTGYDDNDLSSSARAQADTGVFAVAYSDNEAYYGDFAAQAAAALETAGEG
jgi:hypothetical protein